MKRLLIILCFAFFALSGASAQGYSWSVGVRVGGDMSGLSGKYNFDASNSVEAVLAIPYDPGFNLLALYERNIPLMGPDFYLYYGAGAHTGAWSYGGDRSKFVLGVDAVAGLEYKFGVVPLAVSLDYKPALNIVGHSGFKWDSFGVGIKIVF